MFFSSKKKEEAPRTAMPAMATAPAAPLMREEEPPAPVAEHRENNVKKREQSPMEYEVLISQNTVINGNINIKGFTRIDGTVDGTIAVDSDLFIGETGNIKASIYAQNAVIAGTIHGNIACKGRLELMSKAKVIGNIKCGVLVVAEGAVFRGESSGFEDQKAYEDGAQADAPQHAE